jgi:hypothetical protein
MDNDSETLLQESIARENEEMEERMEDFARDNVTPAVTAPTPVEAKSDKENHSQWALGGNGRFMPVGATEPNLPSGIYEPFAVPGMWGLEQTKVSSDGIYLLPDMATEIVLNEVKKFWESEDKYRAHKLLYKRGVLLYGAPGGGKTVAVKLLMNELVQRNGIVIIAQNINLTVMCLKAIRRIEPKRNLIVVLEDVDEIINFNGESLVLSMLDGENNIDNVLHLATTNYPERLGARITNRPSRFDRKIEVGMPNADSRKVYLEAATNKGISETDLTTWVTDTEGMSIAHLRELVAAVYCLDQPYPEVIERLKEMAKFVVGDDGFKKVKLGFNNRGGAPSASW